MKPLHRFCLPFVVVAILLTVEVGVPAHETFAPLLTENTVAFFHVDFSKVDVDLLKTEAKKLGETLLTTLGFDDRSRQATLRDLELELEKWDVINRPILELITKELGVTELAWIADETLFEQGIYFMVCAPWKGKTDADLQKLFAVMPEQEYREAYLPIGDFLFVVFPIFPIMGTKDIPAEKQILTEWVKNAATDNSSPVLQALKNLNKSDEVKAVVRIPEFMKQVLQMAPFPPDMPIQVRNLLLFAGNNVEWIAASVPVMDILTGKEVNNWRMLTVKMPSEDDAKMLREMMVSAIDGGIPAIQLQLQSQAAHPSEVPPPLAFEFLKGYLRTLLPVVEGDKLIFQGSVAKMWLKLQTLDRSALFLFLVRIPALNDMNQ